MNSEDHIALLEDDFVVLQGTTNRVLREEVELLAEALTALEKGKGHVVKDHIERVIDRLKAHRRWVQDAQGWRKS